MLQWCTKKQVYQKTGNLTLFLTKINLSIYPKTWIFSDCFLIFEIFFLVLKKRSKVTKFGYVFAKRLYALHSRACETLWSAREIVSVALSVERETHWEYVSHCLKKFLDNRSKRFANTTQTFFDKRGFQKLGKNSYVFGQIDKSILAKKIRYRFFLEQFFCN